MGTSCDLYRFYDSDERLLYVGISLHAAQRASEHRAGKHWWTDVARMNIEHLESREDALKAERTAIIAERPLHNVVHRVPEADDSTNEAAVEFHFPYRMAELFAVQSAIDSLGRLFDKEAKKGEATPTRGEFIGLIQAIARSVMYGDCCSECMTICYPIALEFTSATFCECIYVCPEGHGPWKCGWTRSLEMMAAMS